MSPALPRAVAGADCPGGLRRVRIRACRTAQPCRSEARAVVREPDTAGNGCRMLLDRRLPGCRFPARFRWLRGEGGWKLGPLGHILAAGSPQENPRSHGQSYRTGGLVLYAARGDPLFRPAARELMPGSNPTRGRLDGAVLCCLLLRSRVRD